MTVPANELKTSSTFTKLMCFVTAAVAEICSCVTFVRENEEFSALSDELPINSLEVKNTEMDMLPDVVTNPVIFSWCNPLDEIELKEDTLSV